MRKNILIIMIITILSKFLGLFRDIALTYFYGASQITDIYLIAQTIPTSLFSILGAGLATSFIPLYSKIRKEKGLKEADEFTSNLINVVLLLVTIIVIFVMFLPEPVIQIYASGFKGEQLRLAILFLRISIIGIYFTAIVTILKSYLNLKNNFIIPALVGIPLNFVSIISYYFAFKSSDLILAFGIIIALLIQLILLIIAVVKLGFKHRFFINLKDPNLRELLTLVIPIFIGVSVNQLGIIVDKNIASRLIEGGISSLHYAEKLNGFVQGLFIAPILTVIYPNMAKYIMNDEMAKFNRVVREALVSVSILVLPATVGATLLAEPIVKLIYMRGEFDAQAVAMTAVSLKYYSLGMLVYAFRTIYLRIFYALQDTKTPMINSIVTMTVDITLNVVLVQFMGIGGLALSTSIGSLASVILLTMKLRKKIPDLGYKVPAIRISKLFVASLIMGYVAKFSLNQLSNYVNPNISLIIAVMIGALLYLMMILLMKIPEVDTLKEFFISKLRRSK